MSAHQPYYSDDFVTIYHGDCRDVLPTLDPVETCITDPPYGLEFMGEDWDRGVPGEIFWRLVSDALLPGAVCLAFGGTRTHHRLMCAIEDAGFEIRDCLMWLYGSGFPKSLDISKAIDKAAGVEFEANPAAGVGFMRPDGRGGYNVTKHQLTRTGESTGAAKLWHGWGTALKPAWEPIVLAMNPSNGTFAANALEHGVAGLNIEGARVGTGTVRTGYRQSARHPSSYNVQRGTPGESDERVGRWPANVVLDEDAAALLDEQSGERPAKPRGRPSSGQPTPNQAWGLARNGEWRDFGDSGGASRFFYTAKASRADRGQNNDHPTVKPSDLMKWLCTLTKTPTGGTVLDPFMGSGTTVYAAKETGRKAIGIEIEERFCEIAAERCAQGVLAL